MMRRWGAWVVVIAAAGGLVGAALALQQAATLAGGLLDAPSLCNISATFNCDAVAASSYATWHGLPVAGLGGLALLVQLMFSVWVLVRSTPAPAVATVGFGFALVGLIPSMWLLVVMFTVLQSFCLYCLGIDLAQWLIVAGWLATGSVRWRGISRRQWLAPLAICAGIFFVGGLMLVNVSEAVAGKRLSPAVVAAAVQAWQRLPQVAMPLDDQPRPAWGASDAKVTVVELSDFQCPFCRQAAFSLQAWLAQFHRDVRFVFVNYPLDATCNEQVQHSMHPHACLAARAAWCAQDAGTFWRYHDGIFLRQQVLSREVLLQLARDEGLDEQQFAACLDDPATDAKVRKDVALGTLLQVQGTPAVFVNGRPVAGWQHKDFLHAVIRAELKP